MSRVSTSSWLNHYLPVDRQRIRGQVWKYVSTGLDTYYHRPDSPLMLAQSPDDVIGFASARDAEEAGYLPGPSITSSFGVTGPRGASRVSQGLARVGHLAQGRGTVSLGSAGVGSSSGGSSSPITLSIPYSQIPRDVLVIILTTDILADTIDETFEREDLLALQVILFQMRRGEIAGRDLGALTGNRQAFQNHGRWLPLLSLLDQAVLSKLQVVNPQFHALMAQQFTQGARQSARLLIPGIAARVNATFGAAVQGAAGRMLRPNPGRRGRGPV